MTKEDQDFVSSLCETSVLRGRVLELGGGYGGETCRELMLGRGHDYRATDMVEGPGVDYVANFETGDGLSSIEVQGPFGTVLVLNVLEHTFDPIAVLDNAVRVADNEGGVIVTVTPAVWPLHNFPVDVCRLLPDWHRWFAESRGLGLDDENFRYVGYGRVSEFRSPDGRDCFPVPGFGRPAYRYRSRLIHRAFNTFGRGMAQPSFLAIGAVFCKSGPFKTGASRRRAEP